MENIGLEQVETVFKKETLKLKPVSSFKHISSQIADTETDIECQTLTLCCQNSVENYLLKDKTFGFQVNFGSWLLPIR